MAFDSLIPAWLEGGSRHLGPKRASISLGINLGDSMAQEFVQIEQLRVTLGLSGAQVLAFARTISHDGVLLSIRHLRRRYLEELCDFMEKEAKKELVTV